MKPDITDCSLSGEDKVRMLKEYVEELEDALRLAKKNLCYSARNGDVIVQINKVLEDDT